MLSGMSPFLSLDSLAPGSPFTVYTAWAVAFVFAIGILIGILFLGAFAALTRSLSESGWEGELRQQTRTETTTKLVQENESTRAKEVA